MQYAVLPHNTEFAVYYDFIAPYVYKLLNLTANSAPSARSVSASIANAPMSYADTQTP